MGDRNQFFIFMRETEKAKNVWAKMSMIYLRLEQLITDFKPEM